jgi:hypothetical protein
MEPELISRSGGDHPVACHFAEVSSPLALTEQAASAETGDHAPPTRSV